LRAFENRVLRRIFRLKRNKVTRGSREVHNEERQKLYSSNVTSMTKSIRMKWAGHALRNTHKSLVATLKGRPMRRWDDKIKMDFKEIG
jgi:thermostable 8-oxoguanine DNA glycosylase